MKMISKNEASYKAEGNEKEYCKDCNMFKPPDLCTLVKGFINRKGHCKYWEAKKKLPTE